MNCMVNELKRSNSAADPLINSTGVTTSTVCTQVEGIVLEPPKLTVGNCGVMLLRGSYWSFNNKTVVEPTKITRRAVVNFSARCDTNSLCRDVLRCGKAKGMGFCTCTIFTHGDDRCFV
ncbi:hypothetical protein Hdeb2414_s0026g00679941 [Helianthus debilis subsp. tardiflorus]